MSQYSVDSSFIGYTLSEQEVVEGAMLNVHQKQVMQNRLAMQAELKVNLRYDPGNPMEFVQQEAALHARIELLREILDQSTAYEKHRAENPL